MMLEPASLIALIAISLVLAAVHSPFWLMLAFGVAAWVIFDRWARGVEPRRSLPCPRTGRPLYVADATVARTPSYVIGDFLTAAGHGRDAVLCLTHAQLAELIRQCLRECQRIGHPSPPSVQVLEAIAPWCGGCGQPYAAGLLRQAWRDATAKGGSDFSPGPRPDGDGRCPRCRSDVMMLVFDG